MKKEEFVLYIPVCDVPMDYGLVNQAHDRIMKIVHAKYIRVADGYARLLCGTIDAPATRELLVMDDEELEDYILQCFGSAK